MIIVDVESSGVDPHKNSLLSIGAVDFADPTRTFYEECRVWDGAHIEQEALEVNGFTRERAQNPTAQSEGDLVKHFLEWASQSPERTIAGHNVSFDRDFMKAAAGRNHIDWPFAQRTIDLHTLAYVDLLRAGKDIPLKNAHSGLSLDLILAALGLPPEPKPHIGINGAKLEAECFARILHGRSLWPEFASFPVRPL